MVTNLRNRPLSSTSVDSLRECVLSLYHNLITGSKDFPPIEFRGSFRTRLTATPFPQVEQERRENATSSLLLGPSGRLEPSSSTARPMLTPVLPERAELEALKADRRNCVRRVEVDGRTVTRVISPVYSTESTVLTNLWRLSDYRADGQVLMSVLCRFTKESAQCARTRQRQKRKHTETSSSCSRPPPEKRMRV